MGARVELSRGKKKRMVYCPKRGASEEEKKASLTSREISEEGGN